MRRLRETKRKKSFYLIQSQDKWTDGRENGEEGEKLFPFFFFGSGTAARL